jgi:hypothetical protein
MVLDDVRIKKMARCPFLKNRASCHLERRMAMKNVQISQELFMKLLRYHLIDDFSCEGDIKKGLEQKMDAMVDRELYTKSKTAPSKEEREKARQEYLDRRGVPDSFRW